MVGTSSYVEKWGDNFDDGVIDSAKWPNPASLVESADPPGTLTHGPNTLQTTSASFASEFTTATEWAYKIGIKVPTGQSWPGNRVGRALVGNDINLYVYKGSSTSTTFQFWVGNSDYTSGTFPWKSGNYNVDTFYDVGIRKEDGVNQYDIFVDGSEVGTDVVSNTYSGTPTTVHFGSGSSVVNWGPVFDYIYVGVPEPLSMSLLAVGGLAVLIRKRKR